MCGKFQDVGQATVAPLFQGLLAQAPSPSSTEGTHAVFGLATEKIRPRQSSGIKPPPREMTSIQALHLSIQGATAMFGLDMDRLQLALFLAAVFFGGLTSGLSGFAMGLVVSGIWLHIISPEQNALLIVLCGLVTQGSGIWRVRNAIKWRTVAPFIIGGALGVPTGTALVTTVDQSTLRLTMGFLLVIFSLYSLIRPALKPVQAGVPADFAVGIANGLIGGLTGLGGIAVTVWCQLRGGPKDAQRGIFQPVMFATFVMSAISFAVARAFTVETFKLYALALPVLIAGIWAGLRLYGKLDDAAFRKIILLLLLVAGLTLIVPMR